jgi:glutamate 5-kinase
MAELRKQITIGSTNSFGTGGIETKLQAAEKAAGFGIPTILANGGKSDIITRLADGSEKATLFLADEECLRRLLGNK